MRATDIQIETPCGQDWQSMKPGDRKRFCGDCKKFVHDLSSMTRAEAREVLHSKPAEGLCVRYLYDAHGDVVFRDTIPATFLSRAKRIAAVAAAAALPMSLAACSGGLGEPAQPPPMPMMGAVACPMEPPPPPTPSGSASALAPSGSASAVAPNDPRFAQPPPAPVAK
jgi:hypothetical protein